MFLGFLYYLFPAILSIIAKLDEGCIVCYNIGNCKL